MGTPGTGPVQDRFEVLKLAPDGSEQRLDEAETFTGAMLQVELAAAKSPGKYVIVDRNTGDRKLFNFESKPSSRKL